MDTELYVVNAGNSTVTVFDVSHRHVAPVLITSGGLYGPSGAALDASGELYVTNPVLDRLSVFDTTHADRVLPSIIGWRNRSYPGGVAVDGSGTLYVAPSASST